MSFPRCLTLILLDQDTMNSNRVFFFKVHVKAAACTTPGFLLSSPNYTTYFVQNKFLRIEDVQRSEIGCQFVSRICYRWLVHPKGSFITNWLVDSRVCDSLWRTPQTFTRKVSYNQTPRLENASLCSPAEAIPRYYFPLIISVFVKF